MKYLKKFEALKDSKLQSSPLSEDEFLKLFRENCKNFSFDNDQLYRMCGSTYPLALFTEIERLGTYGGGKSWPAKYGQYKGYAQLFQKAELDRETYPVLRTHSLIGITKHLDFAQFMYGNTSTYTIIPYDGTKIVISAYPDLGFKGKSKDMTKDDFIMVTYDKGFKVPVDELNKLDTDDILDRVKKSPMGKKFGELGSEFFTNGPCLLVDAKKIEWLKSQIL